MGSRRHNKSNDGRISALVVAAVILIVVAMPFTAIQFNTGHNEGAPLVTTSYDANGGDKSYVVPSVSTFENGLRSSEVRFDPLPAREGHVFIGWSTSPSGPVKYDFTTPYEDRFFVGTDDATFYAQWQEIPSGSKFSLSSNVTADREITWDASVGKYQYRLGTEEWQVLEDKDNVTVIEFSGGTLTAGTIIFSLTDGVPFPDDHRLYVVFDNINVEYSSSSKDAGNVVNINPGAKVILQLVGDNTILHDGGTNSTNATIRAASIEGMQSELIITGQGDGNLTIKKVESAGYDTVNPAIGSVIGGNGNLSSAGNNGETAGHIQIESGKLDIAYKATRVRGAIIGGGGASDGNNNGGDGGLFEMHGGSVKTYQEATGASISSPAIGGGGMYVSSNNRAGHGGTITITGGSLDITQFCEDQTYGVRGSAIGGAASRSAKAGDSGAINISGGNIIIHQTGGAVSGSGIGAASAQNGPDGDPGQAIGTNETGGKNYIAISGGHIEIYQSNTTTKNGTLTGAGIGGGAGAETSVKGGGADVRISGGYVLVDKTSTSDITNSQGAGIGGGAFELQPSVVIITGGNVNVKVTVPSGSGGYAGAAIGSNLDPHPDSSVRIDGGLINISRREGTTEMTVPIGPNGDFGKSPFINGGSIRASADMDLTSGGISVYDTERKPLMRYVVDLNAEDNPQSLFVRKAGSEYAEYNNTKRYVDFHIQGKHKDLYTSEDYFHFNLYLPEGSPSDLNEISLEYNSNGLVKTFSAYGGDVSPTDTGTMFYRVVYRLGEKLRYEDDIVHIDDATPLKQSIRAKTAYLGSIVAPWNVSFVEMHEIDYNDDNAAKSVTDLDGQYRYFASETPFVLAAGTAPAATSYGNIEFSNAVTGRIVITAGEVSRVNVQYRDDTTHAQDPNIPAARDIERIFGGGYPINIGLSKDSDPVTGPWTQNGAPIAAPFPEPDDVIWTSDYFMFGYWRIVNMDSRMLYGTNDPYFISTSSRDLIFSSVWEGKGKIYCTENGPGHIEYSLDGGETWKAGTAADAGGTFFTIPIQTVLLKAIPDMGAVFLQWGDDYGHVTGKNSTESVTLIAPGDTKYATADFGAEEYKITAVVSGDGKISPEGSVSVGAYQNQLFVIEPRPGSKIKDVIVDGISVGPVTSYTFSNVISDHMIEALFSPLQLNITVTGDEGVTVNPSGRVSVQAKSDHTVFWTAKSGYEIKNVVIDSVSHPELADAGRYMFTNVLSDHAVVVTTEKAEAFYLIIAAEGKGYAEYSLDNGETFAKYTERLELEPGKDLILRAVSEDGYKFTRWDGSVHETSETFTISNITSNVTETLVFQAVLDVTLVLTIAGVSISLSIIVIFAWARGRVDVVMIDSESALIIGKRIARVNKPYRFFVDFIKEGGFVSYRVGENKVWKESTQSGGRYEIPEEDVIDTLTIKVR